MTHILNAPKKPSHVYSSDPQLDTLVPIHVYPTLSQAADTMYNAVHRICQNLYIWSRTEANKWICQLLSLR